MEINRIYICYLITTLLISIFVYSLVSSNLQNMKKLERLREEVDDIAHLILETPYNGKTDSKYLTDLIDNFIKKRLAGIWDDLYSLKKQIKSRDCTATLTQNSKNQQKMEVAQMEERVNYAAAELGARILNVKAEPICSGNILKTWLGMEFNTNPPINMLRSTMEPGSCLVLIDQFLMQHITKKQSPSEDISSAPKDFQVFGLQNNDEEFYLGTFKFDNNQPVQYFNIKTNERFQNLRIQFDSNHGHPNYTCVL
ncbi:SUN domain-containing protein 3-like [Lucilia sericata]|uniref:SUN domain-containing protein 3-like n=1 Tax=Lucilia sericata TaxID=13632 RepID=UPI0018A81347|nr:SUN domain-containing protein 3-like [Lucilia sericata]